MANPERRPQEQIPINPARRGANMFILASMEYSASAACQGARIAQLCQEEGLQPSDLQQAIINSPEEIQRLHQAANNAHSKRKPSLLPVPIDSLVRIMTVGFALAQDIMELSPNTIEEILAKHKPEYPNREADLRTFIRQAVDTARANNKRDA